MPLPPFFLAERGRRFCFSQAKGGRQGRGVWYQGGAAAPAGLALADPTARLRFFFAAPAPRKMFSTTAAKPSGPPAPPAWGGKGGRWVRPRRGGLLRLRLVLAFRCFVFCVIGRGATTGGRNRRGPRSRRRRSPPRPAWGVWGASGWTGALGRRARARAAADTTRRERETEEGGGICAVAPGGRRRNHNRTCPITRAL